MSESSGLEAGDGTQTAEDGGRQEGFIVCEGLLRIFKVAENEVVALQGLDLTVAAGEMLGIVGASGSGKTTLLNVLGGLDRPSAGKVLVGGVDLLKAGHTRLDRYRREEVGFLWQQTTRNLLPYLTVLENVELPLLMAGAHGAKEQEWVRELVQAVGLWDRRDRLPQHLSGGQQQRVALALALANRPRLLLADEPTGELDTQTAADLLQLLREINRRYGTTMLVVTHDPGTAATMDRVVTMRDGRTSEETVHRIKDLEAVLAAGVPSGSERYLVVDAAGRLQLPEAMMEAARIGRRVVVELQGNTIVLRPAGEEPSYGSPSE